MNITNGAEMPEMNKIARIGVAFAATCGITSCSEYLDRKETIFFGAGEAVAINQLAHTTDPWPAHAANTHFPVSGERTAAAVRRYQDPPKTSGGPSTVINVR